MEGVTTPRDGQATGGVARMLRFRMMRVLMGCVLECAEWDCGVAVGVVGGTFLRYKTCHVRYSFGKDAVVFGEGRLQCIDLMTIDVMGCLCRRRGHAINT